LGEQHAPGVAFVNLAPPRPTLAINAVWSEGAEHPTVTRLLTAASLAAERGWQ